MSARFLLYGATGYTGKLIARTARERDLPVVLAGRDAARVTALAERLGVEGRAVRLEETERLDAALRDVDVVLNAAGPFAATAQAVVDACLRTGTHYLDVAGELSVFQHLHRLDAVARAHGLMLMPGVGINVVASDCLAAHVTRRLPAAHRLRIGISRTPYISRGSLRTLASLLAADVVVCREGALVHVPAGSLEHDFDFGRGRSSSLAVSWPDVLTAFLSTGVPNVEAYAEFGSLQRALLRLSRGSARMWNTALGQTLLNADAALLAEGPSYEDQKTRRRAIVVEAEDGHGARVGSRLRTPEGYWFTALSALGVVERVLAGEFEVGFQTPARVYGADFVLRLDGVLRDDLPA